MSSNEHISQDQWLAEIDRLQDFGETLEVHLPGSSMVMVESGQIFSLNSDALARWCLERTGLEPVLITAPSWSCCYRLMKGDVKASFGFWSLDDSRVGVYRTDPDEETRPPREDGRPQPSERGMWDRCYVIPDMPIPEDPVRPEGWLEEWSREERQATLDAERPRQMLLDVLALAHFAQWLLSQ